ncbi:N-substituted formamide deformylase [Paraburkholderia caffeinitolerans]|uniref:N-substituted formamide deformylase n=1 Tax=Paraburkholderia caffeinitolerans TaxID=1723730 RepID=A0A6J5GIB7_9BURK|nr:amidohydrolase [Paraburkholderia caffeinitolerans]CAB3801220.1 N-substituted formamide deformylase [Paraburkholderia caffeinitolerans]
MKSRTVIFSAKKIITMNRSRPYATHVAVRDGRILAVGTLDEMSGWDDATLDNSFADKTLMPGFVEGHAHLLEGSMWEHVYVGYFDRCDPDGKVWPGLKSIDDVVARLAAAARELGDPSQPLLAWGFDPIFFGNGPRMSAHDLDRVSTQRPVVILHMSNHLLNVNRATLARVGIDRHTAIDGVPRDDNGDPSGELQEFAAMFPVLQLLRETVGFNFGEDRNAARNFANIARRVGITTSTDLANPLSETGIANLRAATDDPAFPIRLIPAFAPLLFKGQEGPAHLKAVCEYNTDKLRFGLVKLVIDGSIQGFTARLRWPHYYQNPGNTGSSGNGLWLLPPSQLASQLASYHREGFQVHMHTNGDEASEVAIDAVSQVLAMHPRQGHRHTLQHAQMVDGAQLARMAELGLCANFFSNHIYYWGDAHYAKTMGPERAQRMNPAASALRCGVPFGMHSDAPVTPLGPLFTAWCATNRLTLSGRVLGESERISVADALHAITLGTAWTLKMDHEIGSIECGKFADFAVLEDDPLVVAPERLKDVRVWGTVLGGRVMPVHQA